MRYLILIGLIAGFLTTIAFIPQVIRAWKLKETKDLSLATFILFSLGVLLWLLYGILQKNPPIILTNLVTLLLSFTILYFKIKYK